MNRFSGILRYTVLKTLDNLYIWGIFLGSLVVLIIYIIIAKEIDFKNAYFAFNAFNFFFILVSGAGIIGGEISHGHIELIFTKPIKRGEFFLYKFLSTLLVSTMLISLLLTSSVFIATLFHFFLKFPLPDFFSSLKLLLYLILNQITTLSLLFFISSWASSPLDSFLLFGGIFFYPMINSFFMARFPSINNLLQTIRDILNPFKIEIFLSHGFSFPALLFHFFIYPLFLLLTAILIVNRKEISK